jgi:phage protein D
MGLYTADEIEESGWPRTLTVQAKAADMRASLKVKRTRSWDETTLGAMVRAIAPAHGLTAKVGDDLASVAVPHVDQTEESDLHLLTRLAMEHDAVAKPGGGYLLFVPRGEAKSATGTSMPALAIKGEDVQRWSLSAAGRGKYLAVKAYWHDVAAAARKEVQAGSGEPAFTITRPFPTEAEALSAAKGKLDALERGTATLDLTVAGLPKLAAECGLNVSGLSPSADGGWVVTKVKHTLDDSGYRCDVSAETPKGNPKGLV